ncbi:MAG TPA: DUF2232 domain-containing protein [Acidimicrobiia bacterium]|jgi:energy-coupling factor transport system ATP-binding protein|nr:DUF2232 domain-containing protein [Acidimicrobiia bacterium]
MHEPPVSTSPRRRRGGRLRADELAEAVVLADLSLVLCLLGHVLPLATILVAAAVVPMATVAVRHRLRAVIAGAAAASAIGFLIAGAGLVPSIVGCAAVGAVVGASARRSWGLARTVEVGVVVLWPPAAALATGALFVLADLRRLALVQVTNSWRGTSQTLRDLGVVGLARAGDEVVRWATRDWWASVSVALLGATAGSVALAWLIAHPTLRRVRAAVGEPSGDAPPDPAEAGGRPDPVPVELRDVEYRYGARAPAVHGVSLTAPTGAFLALVGPNGAGKSTLARILVGRPPTGGAVARPGPVGLGRRHGSAIVFQRPEAQVLGVRVRDDVVWGVPVDAAVDVEGILDRVGLGDLADRDTSTLSGGELQRLAIGAALARGPRLLVSDESTAMVDPEGRETLVELLRDLTTADGVTVVHVTHRRAECRAADQVLALDAGRLVVGPEPPAAPSRARVTDGAARRHPTTAEPVLSLRGVGHEYARGTPWVVRALRDVDLELGAGEGLLVLGRNGSGKSTLAWILAGLIEPTDGAARLGGRPLQACTGQVALALQHARLQLLRSTVGADVSAASGADPATVAAALEAVGLDPAAFATRRVDELSGGETRRVALAGMLARHPRVLVLDEPFAGLDDAGRESLGALLVRLRASGVTVVVVSHDPDLPDDLVERVLELEHGRVVHLGPRRDQRARR